MFVVDTSNEIAGDGDLPHASIGRARRLQVPSLAGQMHTMIECVQVRAPPRTRLATRLRRRRGEFSHERCPPCAPRRTTRPT